MEEAAGKSETLSYVRVRRVCAAPQPTWLTFLDGLAIFLLILASLAGTQLFGAVRMWSIGPLMIASFLGIAVTALRRVLFPHSVPPLHVPVAGWGWLAWLLYVALAGWRSAVPYESKIEWLKIASYVGAYWAWTDLSIRRGRWRWLLGLIIFWVTLIAWYALIQHAQGSRMVLGMERPAVYRMRASGTYVCPNHFAALLEIVLPLSLALVFCSEAKAPLRLLGGYAFLICLPVLFLTMSRSGWLGTLCGVGIVVALLTWRRSARAFMTAAVAGLLLATAIAGAAWHFSPDVRERIRGASLDHPDPAVQARFEMWRDTRAMIRAAPWLGYGPGSYVWTFPKFKKSDAHMLFNYAHNEYLHTAAEYGLPGLAMIAIVVVWMVIKLLQKWRSVSRARDATLIAALLGIMAAQAVHAIFDFNLHIFSIWHVLALVAGVVSGGLYSADELTAPKLPPTHAKVILSGWAGAALVLAILAGQVYASYGFHRLGEKAWERLQLDRAERWFRYSAKVDPWFWRAYQGIGHVARTRAIWCWDAAEKKGWAHKALKAYEKAWMFNRLDVETRYAMATLHNLLGEKEKALALMREVVSMHPTHLFYLNRLGLQLRQMGRYREALEVFREVQRRWGTTMASLNIRYLEDELRKSSESTSAP